MFGLGESIVIVIVVFILVLWLGKKSPDIAKSAGQSIREFKEGMKELPKQIEEIKTEIKK